MRNADAWRAKRLAALTTAALLIGACGAEVGADEYEETSPDSAEDDEALRLRDLWGEPGVRLVTVGERATSEAGRPRAVLVSLASPPRARVTVSLSVSDASEGAVSPQQLQFSPFTWWLPRPVRVVGASDLVLDGDQSFDVRAQTSSSDPAYANVEASVRFTNRERAAFHVISDPESGRVMAVPRAVSSSGEVVVGSGPPLQDAGALRWSASEGMRQLAGEGAEALGVSPDGSWVVGHLYDSRWETSSAAVRWPPSSSEPEYLHEPLEPPYVNIHWFTWGRLITDQGVAYGECVQYGAYGVPLGCLNEDGINDFLPGTISYVRDITSDVSHYVGQRLPTRGEPTGPVAVLDGEPIGYPDDAYCIVPHPCSSDARAVSEDGSLVVGFAFVPEVGSTNEEELVSTAFLYTAGVMVRLPDLPGGESTSAALAMSSDGAVVGGYGSDAQGQQAVLWIQGQPVRLTQLLSEAGATVPAGLSLRQVVALSEDGRTVVGIAMNEQEQSVGFRALLPGLR